MCVTFYLHESNLNICMNLISRLIRDSSLKLFLFLVLYFLKFFNSYGTFDLVPNILRQLHARDISGGCNFHMANHMINIARKTIE